jgi:hypothetical protein
MHSTNKESLLSTPTTPYVRSYEHSQPRASPCKTSTVFSARKSARFVASITAILCLYLPEYDVTHIVFAMGILG